MLLNNKLNSIISCRDKLGRIKRSSWQIWLRTKCTICLNESRQIVAIAGPDTNTFLNGLTTFAVPFEGLGRYGAILNTHGRVLFDIFLIKNIKQHDTYFIDTESSLVPHLLKFFRKYKLRSKIECAPMAHLRSFSIFDHHTETLTEKCIKENIDPSAIEMIVKDTRAANWNVYRAILNPENISSDLISPASLFRQLRYTVGIPEGSEEIQPEVALPIECNLDYMNGIDFNKGCYIGQELTTRTHLTGVVRKRVMPVSVEGNVNNLDLPCVLEFEQKDHGDTSKPLRRRPPGKLISVEGNKGLAVLQMSMCFDGTQPRILKHEDSDVKVTPIFPTWLLPHTE